jgi:hypothetical protein
MRVLVTSLLLTTGCLAPDGDESFIIRDNLATAGDGTCAFTATLGAPTLSRGLIDDRTTLSYIMTPMFESRVIAAEGRESLRTIQIEGAEVTVELGPISIMDADGNVTVDDFFDDSIQFTTLFSSSLSPNGGLALGTLDAIPLEAINLVRNQAGPDVRYTAQAVAVVKAFGSYYGGDIESQEYRYPVAICNDCIGFTLIGPCDTANPAATPLGGTNGCNPLQDGAIECCSDVGDPMMMGDEITRCAGDLM